eukprot:TRINITY_DN785_c0_g1_i1.p2 TRINITY_DN785_c0_g1~~TRINITY_DN785_c0_g1_i1.p2  ORF type:complete len:62 (+),score=9.25 TRINITY_DN785_c0_g1_i1:696-881(+)
MRKKMLEANEHADNPSLPDEQHWILTDQFAKHLMELIQQRKKKENGKKDGRTSHSILNFAY